MQFSDPKTSVFFVTVVVKVHERQAAQKYLAQYERAGSKVVTLNHFYYNRKVERVWFTCTLMFSISSQ